MEPTIPLPRVLMVANSLDIGGLHGGAERFAAELCLGAQRSGWPVCLALLTRTSSPFERSWEKCLQASGVRIVYLACDPRRDLLKGLGSLAQICAEERVDILHSHSKIGSLLAAGLRRSGRVACALQTVHAGQEWGKGPGPWLLRQVVSKWIFGLALDAQVGVSQPISQRLRQSPGARLARRPAIYLPNALKDDWFDTPPAAGSPILKNNNTPVIGIVGVLNALKGHRTLLAAAAIAQQAFPGLQVWIIGDGPERARLIEQARRLGLERQVTFWGAQDNVRALLDRMDLFVFPSLTEGLPTVVLESMARGVPVVASDIPGNRELVENGVTGWLVPALQPALLAGAIQHALLNPVERGAIAQRAYQKAGEFRFSAILPRYLQLYRTLMKVV